MPEQAPELDPLRGQDEWLTPDELDVLAIFEGRRVPFSRFLPGTVALRYFEEGTTVCVQGAAGESAFYVLTPEDVVSLREAQLATLAKVRAARSEGDQETLRGEAAPELLRATDEELDAREEALESERRRFQEESDLSDGGEDDADRRQVATARLIVNLETRHRKKGLVNRSLDWLFGRTSTRRRPRTIPTDLPTEIDAETLEAPLNTGDVFGEMSCMNRVPRSATVVVRRPCYMIEMLRNVFDALHRDDGFRRMIREKYRDRVVEGHIRRLSIFEDVSDEEFARLKSEIDWDEAWVECEPGDVVFEQGDESDAVYIVHSGLVKVVENVHTRLRAGDFSQDDLVRLREQLESDEDNPLEIRGKIREALPGPLLERWGSEGQLDAAGLEELTAALNAFVVDGDLVKYDGCKGRWKSVDEIVDEIDDAELAGLFESFPQRTENWSELERRLFHRRALELAFPGGVPRRAALSGPRRTLAYLGRGELLGEIGVIGNQPRSATVVAYDHPDRPEDDIRVPSSRQGIVSRVELLKIRHDLFDRLRHASPSVEARIQQLVKTRTRPREEPEDGGFSEAELADSPQFHDMGLVQGQKLMLVDLDRCTRCNACVEACVSAHTDGRTRLYLDGGRFRNYLVPLTCRSCMDPVCMIGCPVGSITRGDMGEIVIEDWCIGCSVCADQCPYGAIQMDEILDEAKEAIVARAERYDVNIRDINRQAVVCDMCSSSHSPGPACVYACPHEAALRVDARTFFLSEPGRD